MRISKAHRYSVRTNQEPMAFTAWELIRGGVAAWGIFELITPFAVFAVGIALEVATNSKFEITAMTALGIYFLTIIYVPWSLGALVLLGLPLAALLGHALRRNSNRLPHLVAFAALGAVVGAVTTLLAAKVYVSQGVDPDLPMILVTHMATTATSVALGWSYTANRALRADATPNVAPQHDAAITPQ